MQIISTIKKKHKLYWAQGKALSPFIDDWESDPLFLCPLCMCVWGKNSVYEKVNGPVTIEHAPQKHAGQAGAERCLTCDECNNGAGGTFERITAELHAARQDARTNPPVSLLQAIKLATATPEERQDELKSAYLIAFATLGYTYILDPSLDQVRSLLDHHHPDPVVQPCAVLSGRQEAFPVRHVSIVRAPIACIVVTYPASHRVREAGHVVILPVPRSPEDFYQRIGELQGGKREWLIGPQYPWPEPRQLPMHWDRDGTNDMRARVIAEITYDCAEPGHGSHEIAIRTVSTSGEPIVPSDDESTPGSPSVHKEGASTTDTQVAES